MSSLYAVKVADIGKKPPAEKKPRSEKQIAAFAKAQETRKRKREEQQQAAELEVEEKQKEVDEAENLLAAAQAKKSAANEKRRLARAAKKTVPTTPATEATDEEYVEEIIEEVLSPLPPPPPPPPSEEEVLIPKVDPESDEPPKWFCKYIENMKKDENKLGGAKKAHKVIKQEAKDIAEEKWAQPKVRQQVNKSIGSHMDRLYGQIFSKC
jgi:hypothetical protein